jgi:hypothetical protein
MEDIKISREELILRYNLLASYIKTLKDIRNKNDMEQLLKWIDEVEI